LKFKTVLLSTLLLSSLQAADDFKSWFSDGVASGNVKYYYIETDKDNGAGTTTSAHANSVGGQLSYKTANLYGLELGATAMSTNPFALPNSVDTSIIGRDNGVRSGQGPSGQIAQQGFTVLGEAYIKYSRDFFNIWYGRQVLRTPLIDAKEVRMLPSAVQGTMAKAAFENGITIEAGYLDRFKQRTSNEFVNIIKHALGANTQAVTGSNAGYVAPISVSYDANGVTAHLYDYYAADFMNSVFGDVVFKNKLDENMEYSVGAQIIKQDSIGTADTNLAQAGSLTGGQKIDVTSFGLKGSFNYNESGLYAAYTNVSRNNNAHDSMVLPWDGTPLYTNMITSNDLFQSNYGKALNADSAYIGGTQGLKLAYSQGFDFSGVEGFMTTLAWAQYSNSRTGFDKNQQDINAVIQYKYDKELTVQLKGIWVDNNTGVNELGVVTQLDSLTQYRVIANYKFKTN